MTISDTIGRARGVDGDGVPPAVRRRELLELTALVAASLAINLLSKQLAPSPTWYWLNVAAQLGLPFGAAWTLRRTAGGQAFAVAAILVAGMLAATLLSTPAARAQNLTLGAMMSAAMVWVLASNPRSARGAKLAAAIILAVAMAAAAAI